MVAFSFSRLLSGLEVHKSYSSIDRDRINFVINSDKKSFEELETGDLFDIISGSLDESIIAVNEKRTRVLTVDFVNDVALLVEDNEIYYGDYNVTDEGIQESLIEYAEYGGLDASDIIDMAYKRLEEEFELYV